VYVSHDCCFGVWCLFSKRRLSSDFHLCLCNLRFGSKTLLVLQIFIEYVCVFFEKLPPYALQQELLRQEKKILDDSSVKDVSIKAILSKAFYLALTVCIRSSCNTPRFPTQKSRKVT
jgi:hypothetical protein